MAKMSGYKAMVMIAGAMIFAGSGLHAEMKCAPGKCGASMMKVKKSGPMSEEQPGEAQMKMKCDCEKKKCKCDKKGEMKGKCGKDMKCAPGKCADGMKEKMKSEMKGKCGEGMKEKMKGEMKGRCGAGKCGGK